MRPLLRRSQTFHSHRNGLALCLAAFASLPLAAVPQHTNGQPGTQETRNFTPAAWAAAANRNELNIIHAETTVPLRYRQRKIDAKGDTTREVIESKQGNIARLVQRNGQPITPAQNAAERIRLLADLDSPDDFLKHQKRGVEIRNEALDLIRLLPQAMLYTFTPGQPQLQNKSGREIVLDYRPNPAFHPPTMAANLLVSLQGRVWIDAQSGCIDRIDAQITRPVEFGFGLLAKIFPGGTIEFEQTHITGDRWAYSHLEEHLTARVLLVKTVPQNASLTSWDFRPISPQPSFQEAIHELLAIPIPLQ
jgi:hypothetical protein